MSGQETFARQSTLNLDCAKNFLFAGSDAGGEVLADAMTVIETAKLSGLNPEAYLTDILGRIRLHDAKRLDDLLPWTWKANRDAEPKAA